eukprot:Nk52_evm1s2036 gene=Nk52_evmTU1s2036
MQQQMEELAADRTGPEGVSDELLQRELTSLKEDLRGWTGLTIAKRLEAMVGSPQSKKQETSDSQDNPIHRVSKEPYPSD